MNAFARVVLLFGALALAGTTGCEKPEPPKATDPATIHREAGDKLLQAGEFSKAAEEYKQSLDADPKQEKVWEKKAYAHQQAGETEKFEEASLKAVEFKPPSAKAEMLRGLAGQYMGKQDLDNAEKYFQEAVKVEPNDDLSLSWLGEIYSRRGGARDMRAPAVPENLDKALAYYDKVIALKPDVVVPYVNKRVIMNKYIKHETQAKEEAEKVAKAAKGEKGEAAKAAVEKHAARIEELKKQSEELSKKIDEVKKKPQPGAPAPAQ